MANGTRNRRLDRTLESETKAGLLAFHNKPPSPREAKTRLLARVGERGEEVGDDLKELTDLGFLFKRIVGSPEAVRCDEVRRIISSQITTSLEAD